jgi:hypothetical protein
MIHLCIQNLNEIKRLLNKLNNFQYSHKSSILSGASIGQHIRHILEFYICLFNGIQTGVVNYDLRERNTMIESNTCHAIQVVQEIINHLSAIKTDDNIILEGNFALTDKETTRTDSSIFRELIYNLEHSIHHQALIKVGLKELGLEYQIEENFGVAPATIRFNTINIERIGLH